MVRAALSDFFYNSWRLVPANAIWGAGLVLVIVLLLMAPLLGLLAFALLALPTAGVFALAALIVRGQPAAFSDSIEAWRRYFVPALLTGLIVGASTALLLFNLGIGFFSGDPIGWIFATGALWGLVAVWGVTFAFWPLLVDPVRAGEPLASRLRLAAAVILVAPARYAALMLVLLVAIIASTVLFAALLTVTVAFVALATCHHVLPLADRLEGRTQS